MSLTLDETLSAAQDSQSRHPLVEVISKEWAGAIPFDGSYLDTTTDNERYPSAITLSTGALAIVSYYHSGAADYLRYVYTDADRTTFTTVDIALNTNEIVHDLSFCQMADGNIGIVFISTYGGTKSLKYRIVTPAGAAVSNGTIRTFASSTLMTSGPSVLTLANDTYLLAFVEQVTADDPDHYHIYRYTSSDFTSWAGPAELSISGLDDTLYKRNPYLIQITTGQVWLWFDYTESLGPNNEELTNCYYATSDDNGSTWSAAVKVTNYDSYDAIAQHPVAVQKVANQLYMLFTEKRGSITMDSDTTGWPYAQDNACQAFHFDAVNRKIYAVIGRIVVGNATIWGVVKIDVDTWTIDKSWDKDSVPAIPSIYWDNSYSGAKYKAFLGSGQYVVFGLVGALQPMFATLLDGENDTIVNYAFEDISGYGYSQNVTWTPASTSSTFYLKSVVVDETNERVWFAFTQSSYISANNKIQIGWIPLTSTDNHTFTDVVNASALFTEYMGAADNHCMRIYPNEDLIVYGMAHPASFEGGSWRGITMLFSLSDGGLYKSFSYATHGEYPLLGLKNPILHDGKIYGGFGYDSRFGQEDFRGLCILDIETETFTYSRPSWASVDNYDLYDYIALPTENLLIISSTTYGVTIFDLLSQTWMLYSNDTVNGLTPNDCDVFFHLAYDAATGLILASVGDSYLSSWTGIVAFSRYGYIMQSQYYIGEYTASWAWTDHGDLVQGLTDYDLVAALDPDDLSIYAFWTRDDALELSTKWDKEGVDFDLTTYLHRDTEIAIKRVIDGKAATLSFGVSHGHLFDIHNNTSLLKAYLKKGRKLTVRFGELVNSTEYWQAMGTFIVISQSVSYQRGKYPVLTIEAEDRTTLWGELEVIATTEYAGTYPEEIIEDVLVDNTDLESGDIEIENFLNRTQLTHQWVETDLRTIVNEIAERYGYYVRVDVDDTVTAKLISMDAEVDHSYSNNSKIIKFEPDDEYSDFTNRVIVTCEEGTEIDVIYDEEQVGTINGSFGWYGGTETHRLWYSQDKSRLCRDARLEVLQSATSIMFQLAGEITETLLDNSDQNPDEDLWYTYCTVIVEADDLTPYLIAALAGLVASYFVPDISLPSGGPTVRVGSYLSSFFIFAALNILASQGTYQYAIHAKPMGKIRRTLQAQWDDLEHQAEIAHVILQEIDDPLCYSVQDAQQVANFTGMVIQAQRKRVNIEKVADLRDEDGDTISIIHPISQQALEIFVTELERVMKMPSSSGNDGYFLDKIEGWVR